MNKITRIDTYLTVCTQAVTFYRGSRAPHTVLNPSITSFGRLLTQTMKDVLKGRARLHPCVTGWTLDLLDTESVP